MSSRLRPKNSEINGIFGNAIPIPEQDDPPVIIRQTLPKPKQEPVKRVPHSAKHECTCGLKEKLAKVQHAEKEARGKIESLIRKCEELKADLEQNIVDGEKALKATVEEYKNELKTYEQKLKTANANHEQFKQNHENCESTIEGLKSEIESLKRKHAEEIENLKKDFESQLNAVKKDRDEQIQLREDKITKMKTQIADKLTGNSSERQKQIDDLLKEMSKLQEEHEVLKSKLRSYAQSRNVKNVCDNCTTSNAKLKVLEERLKEREVLVTELKGMCEKFDKQLRQNDHLGTVVNRLK